MAWFWILCCLLTCVLCLHVCVSRMSMFGSCVSCMFNACMSPVSMYCACTSLMICVCETSLVFSILVRLWQHLLASILSFCMLRYWQDVLCSCVLTHTVSPLYFSVQSVPCIIWIFYKDSTHFPDVLQLIWVKFLWQQYINLLFVLWIKFRIVMNWEQ